VPPVAIVVGFSWTFAVATLLLLAARSPYVIGLVGAAAFFLVPALGSLLLATISTEAPDELQGRAIAGAIQIASLGAPLAPLLAGVSAGAIGARHTILAYGGFLMLLALGASLHSSAWRPSLTS
jgi:hypothetical protein